MARPPDRDHPLLGPALFLIPPRPAKGRVEAMGVQGLLQPLGLPHVRMQGAVIKGVDPLGQGFGILVHDEVEAELPGRALAHLVHRLELPGGVHMQQREGRAGGEKSLGRQMQHDRRVLSHRIEHDRALALGDHLAEDLQALGLQALQMGEGGQA